MGYVVTKELQGSEVWPLGYIDLFTDFRLSLLGEFFGKITAQVGDLAFHVTH